MVKTSTRRKIALIVLIVLLSASQANMASAGPTAVTTALITLSDAGARLLLAGDRPPSRSRPGLRSALFKGGHGGLHGDGRCGKMLEMLVNFN
jgi:hypothetical protein